MTLPEQKGSLVRDPEVQVMAKIAGLLASLDEDAKKRVLTWVVTKHTEGKFHIVLKQDVAES